MDCLEKPIKLTTLQSNVAPVEQLPDNSALVIDGMSLVHKVKGEQTTFAGVVSAVLQMVLREGKHSNSIDVVFDTYKENSIKKTVRGCCKVKRLVISFRALLVHRLVISFRALLVHRLVISFRALLVHRS